MRGRRDRDRDEISLRVLVGDLCQDSAYQVVLGVEANESSLEVNVGWCKSLTAYEVANRVHLLCSWPCLAVANRYLTMNRGSVADGLEGYDVAAVAQSLAYSPPPGKIP